MTARLTLSISNSSGMGSRSFILGFTVMSATLCGLRSRRMSRPLAFRVITAGHTEFFAEVVTQLKREGADDIAVFGGGGGTITHEDAREMKRKGVDQIFFAGT